jgi:thymidine phosphorylase
MYKQLQEVGAVICAAGSGLAPADRKLYSLRDVTGTVEAIPLIASSIMSKKIAEGTSSLVLDVKVGSGAFMKTLERATELANVLVQIGNDAGVKTSALLTDMSTPLGRKIGNSLEVEESVEVLSGGGPSDVIAITVELAREMLAHSGLADVDPLENLQNGKAMDKWREMISAQGGNPAAELPKAKHSHVVVSENSGFISKLDALSVGVASWRLGAGRERKEDSVQFGAGVELHAQLGERIEKGQPLLTLFTDTPEKFARAQEALVGAVEYSEIAPSDRKFILGKVS